MFYHKDYFGKLTKLAALYFQWKIWNQLPSSEMEKTEILYYVGIFDSDCPSCEYDVQTSDDCRSCPSRSIWGNEDDTCISGKSYFTMWDDTREEENHPYDSQFFALLIAEETKRLFQENLS